MGVGSAVAGIAGGFMQMGAASKYQKMGEEASKKSEEYLGRAEGALDTSMQDWYKQLDFGQEYAKLLEGIGQEYGEFASQYFQEWEEDFGGIFDNLKTYYEELDPTRYSTQMKAAIGQNLDKQMEQFQQTAAQSGIYTSGMGLQAQKENQFNKAQQFAQADIQAPDMVAQMQNQLYGQYGEPMKQNAYNLMGQSILNKGQMTQMGFMPQYNTMGNIAGMGSQYANLYGGMADRYLNSASGYGSAAGQSAGRGMNNFMGGMNSLFGGSGGGFMGMF